MIYNQAVVKIWESGSTHANETMALLVRLLYYCAARYINVCIVHIAGVNNEIAKCLSRFQQDKFRWLVPLANPAPDNIPMWLTQSFIDASCNATILAYVAPSTRQTYQSGLNPFIKFCSQFGIIPFPAPALTLDISVPRHQNMSHTKCIYPALESKVYLTLQKVPHYS